MSTTSYKPLVTKAVTSTNLVMMCVMPILWMCASSGLILLNKYLMRDKGFSYPMALSGLGQAVSGVAAFLVCRVFTLVKADRTISLPFFLKHILPIGIFMALTLMAGNAVYMHLSVSFIQMLKAFTPVITMLGLFLANLEMLKAFTAVITLLGLFLANLETPSRTLIFAVSVIAVGTVVASYGEVHLSAIGIFYMMSSEVAEAARLVMTQFLLQGLNFHPLEGVMYLAPACVFWLAIGSCIFEVPRMIAHDAASIVRDNLLAFALAGCMGFAVNALAFISIKLCGSLTLKVLGTIKSSALVAFCVVFLGEVVTSVQAIGYTVAVVGFAWYQQIKMSAVTPPELPASDSLEQEILRKSSSLQGAVSDVMHRATSFHLQVQQQPGSAA